MLIELNCKILIKGFVFGLFSGQDQTNVPLTLQMETNDWGPEGLQIALFSLQVAQLQVGTEVWGTC